MKTILIVDDEPAARYGLRRALESKYRIAEADSAEVRTRRFAAPKNRIWCCSTWFCRGWMDSPFLN